MTKIKSSAYSKRVYHHYPNEVAEKYAEWLWGDSPCNPSCFEKNIEVMDDKGKVRKFSVTAEVDVIFNAEELDDVAED